MKNTIICVKCGQEITNPIWRDIVLIDGKYYPEQIEIEFSDDDEPFVFNCDPFFAYIEEKYKCTREDIKTLLFDILDIPDDILKTLPYTMDDCGGICLKCDKAQ